MRLTVIVPAFNEEAYLAPTLRSIRAGADEARAASGADVNVVVVDNASVDETAAVAALLGATVVHEPVQGIARARNAGAHGVAGDVLVFFDADVDVPRSLLAAICAAMRDPACVGGGRAARSSGSTFASGGSSPESRGWCRAPRSSVAGTCSPRSLFQPEPGGPGARARRALALRQESVLRSVLSKCKGGER